MLLTEYAVAIATLCVTKMAISCLPITRHFFDTTIKAKFGGAFNGLWLQLKKYIEK